MDENENQAGQLTINDLKGELPNQDFETLTLGEDTVAVRALLKLRAWFRAPATFTAKKTMFAGRQP